MRTPSLVLVFLAAWAAGCGGPTVTIRHVLGPDLPVGAAGSIFVEPFTVSAGGDAAYGQFAAAELRQRLEASGLRGVAASAGEAKLAVGATLHISSRDVAASRAIRRYDPRQRRMVVADVPALTRTASVRADFVVKDARTGRRLGGAEARETYDSADDPRTRGRLGLDRPDAPARVPSTDAIVRELIAQCVDTFADMIEPHELTVAVQLCPAGGPEAREGLAAAAAGDFAAALGHFTAALDAQPDSTALTFDAAVAAEGAGELPKAATHYEAVLQRTDGRDAGAKAGLDRVRRIMARK